MKKSKTLLTVVAILALALAIGCAPNRKPKDEPKPDAGAGGDAAGQKTTTTPAEPTAVQVMSAGIAPVVEAVHMEYLHSLLAAPPLDPAQASDPAVVESSAATAEDPKAPVCDESCKNLVLAEAGVYATQILNQMTLDKDAAKAKAQVEAETKKFIDGYLAEREKEVTPCKALQAVMDSFKTPIRTTNSTATVKFPIRDHKGCDRVIPLESMGLVVEETDETTATEQAPVASQPAATTPPAAPAEPATTPPAEQPTPPASAEQPATTPPAGA